MIRVLLALLVLCSPAWAQQGQPVVGLVVSSQVVTGTFNLTTGTGAVQNLTFGFTPSSCDGYGSTTSTLGLYTTFNSHSDSAGGQGAILGTTGGSALSLNNAVFFAAVDATNTNFQTAVISYSANTATLTWTKTGTPTGTFSYSVRCFK